MTSSGGPLPGFSGARRELEGAWRRGYRSDLYHGYYLEIGGARSVRDRLLFAVVVADLGVASEELAEGPLLFWASGRCFVEDAYLPGVNTPKAREIPTEWHTACAGMPEAQ